MIVQAIIDAIIDLAIPVTNEYQNVIGDLELDVLTEPSIKHTTALYVVTSEIAAMRGFISPIVNLINALKDHKSAGVIAGGRSDMQKPASPAGLKISPMAQTYLGDVEDHIILMTESLDQMRRSCDNMIDLIFNTISAYQNESMKQLTVVTIVFLPMSFLTGKHSSCSITVFIIRSGSLELFKRLLCIFGLALGERYFISSLRHFTILTHPTGYFGMNLHTFTSLDHGEPFFWSIAIPVALVVIMFCMKDMLKWWFMKVIQRRGISRSRKGRLSREAQARRNR